MIGSAVEVLTCERCGWQGEGVPVTDETAPPRGLPEGDCTVVHVPLWPPFKRPNG